eukprot:1837588-Rhodomonas_salina.1
MYSLGCQRSERGRASERARGASEQGEGAHAHPRPPSLCETVVELAVEETWTGLSRPNPASPLRLIWSVL